MNIFSGICAGSLLVFICLTVLVISRNPRSALNWFCAAVSFCMALWAFEDIFHNLQPPISEAAANLFYNVGTIGGYSFAGFFLLFALVLTGRQKLLRSWLTYVVILGFPALFIFGQWSWLGGIRVMLTPFGWVQHWTLTFWSVTYVLYYVTAMLLGLILIIRFGRRTRDPRQRRQAALIFATTLATFALGTLDDVVLVTLTHGHVPAMANSFGIIWATGLVVSITKYGLMSITPETAAQDILATMMDSLMLLAPDGRTVIVNKALLDRLGYARAEVADQSAALFFEQPWEFANALAEVRTAGSLVGRELNCRTRDGRTFPVMVSARVMQKEDAPLYGSVWVLRDITRLREAEATLRESEEKYRNLVERANDGIVIIQDSILRFANERAAAMLDTTVPAVAGTAFTEHVHPDSLREVAERYEHRMAGDSVPATYESALRRRDGTKLEVELNAGVVTYQGRPADLVFIRDITERKRAADEIRAHAERLERLNLTLDDERRKLLDLTEQLTVVNEELKRVSEAKSEFVAAASHDLRTPLTTIIEGIRMTEEGSLGPVNAEQREFLSMAREDALRLRDLIGTLLDVAKIERGKMQASKTSVDARDIADRIAKTYGSYARDKKLHLITDLPPAGLFVYCDAGHFHRILSNLMNNAVKFTPPGGSVTIRVQATETGLVRTTVKDTGVGIPRDQQHRVFGRFEQIRRPSGDLQSGTGLGLALCRQLVELNGGTIEFESVEHEGSTFHFELPEYRGQAPTGEERRPAPGVVS